MEESTQQAQRPDKTTIILRWVVAAVVVFLVSICAWYAYAYAITPQALRYPTRAHYHFRLQIIVASVPVNFAASKFQTVLGSDICTAALTTQPIHFHDNLDQFVHIHWDHLTGGILLKNYGWNLIGGTAHTLGYRFDKFPKLARVPIHGQDLPSPGTGAHYYIYTGDEHGYKTRTWQDFLKSDLKSFFGSTLPSSDDSQSSEVKLAKLNDVIGSVVIFAQTTPPTDAQIKYRFDHLIPLPDSTCSG